VITCVGTQRIICGVMCAAIAAASDVVSCEQGASAGATHAGSTHVRMATGRSSATANTPITTCAGGPAGFMACSVPKPR
jgi:hypothetical protein